VVGDHDVDALRVGGCRGNHVADVFLVVVCVELMGRVYANKLFMGECVAQFWFRWEGTDLLPRGLVTKRCRWTEAVATFSSLTLTSPTVLTDWEGAVAPERYYGGGSGSFIMPRLIHKKH